VSNRIEIFPMDKALLELRGYPPLPPLISKNAKKMFLIFLIAMDIIFQMLFKLFESIDAFINMNFKVGGFYGASMAHYRVVGQKLPKKCRKMLIFCNI
jgi:hypothetical protein